MDDLTKKFKEIKLFIIIYKKINIVSLFFFFYNNYNNWYQKYYLMVIIRGMSVKISPIHCLDIVHNPSPQLKIPENATGTNQYGKLDEWGGVHTRTILRWFSINVKTIACKLPQCLRSI